MTREEFIESLEGISYVDGMSRPEINDEDFQMIEMVYSFHPAIALSEGLGKTQMAMIYAYGGMRVIRDMVPTAARAKQIKVQIREVQAKKRNLLAQLEELATGKPGEEVIME